MGGTGDPPVPVGDLADRNDEGVPCNSAAYGEGTPFPFRPAGRRTDTGQWPVLPGYGWRTR